MLKMSAGCRIWMSTEVLRRHLFFWFVKFVLVFCPPWVRTSSILASILQDPYWKWISLQALTMKRIQYKILRGNINLASSWEQIFYLQDSWKNRQRICIYWHDFCKSCVFCWQSNFRAFMALMKCSENSKIRMCERFEQNWENYGKNRDLTILNLLQDLTAIVSERTLKLSSLQPLQIVICKDPDGKSMIISSDEYRLVSPVSEGFEHNWRKNTIRIR